MKLNIVIWESLNFLGGGQKLSLEIAKALEHKYDVRFLLSGAGELSESVVAKGYNYKFFFNRNFSRGQKGVFDILKFLFCFPVTFVSSLIAMVKLKPGVIYSNAASAFVFSAIIGTLLRRPVIWSVHNYYQDRKVVALLHIFGRLGSVKRIIFDSEALEKQFPTLSRKTVTIYPGIDLAKQVNFQKNRNIRSELNISKDAHIIVQIGWVTETKGQHLTIDSAKYVYEKRKDVCFLIIGKNLKGQELYLSRLRQKVKDYELEAMVHLLGFYEDIKSVIDESFLNVIASFEGFPLVMLETAALNVPTIGPNVGGPGAAIKDGINGLVYKFGDAKDLASKILCMLENKKLYNGIRRNTTEFVSNYTLEKYRNNILSVVEQVLVERMHG